MLKLNSITEKYDIYWFNTLLPKKMAEIMIEEIETTMGINQNDFIYGAAGGDLNMNIRESKIQWFSSENWIGGLCHHFVNIANQNCFRYDLDAEFQNNSLQYTTYSEGEFYTWHTDTDAIDISGRMRKLSFTLQLSDPSDYEGGELQIMESSSNRLFTAPKELGSLIIFDSSLKHRVRKVKKGFRKSLVGWVAGPRFK